MECAMRLVRVGRRLESQTADAAGLHAPTAAAALQAAVSAQRVLLFKRIVSRGEAQVILPIVGNERV